MIFHENHLLVDDSHEISHVIFFKIRKDVAKLSSAAVMISAARANVYSPVHVIWYLSHLHMLVCFI